MPEGGIGTALAVFVNVVEELLAEAGILLEQHLEEAAFRLGAGNHEAPGRKRDLGGRPGAREHGTGAAHRHLG